MLAGRQRSRPEALLHGAWNAAAGVLLDSPRWAFNVTLFALGSTLSVCLSHDLFQAIPHLDDAVAALYQAQIFQQGRLVWPVDPAIKPFFDTFGVITPIGRPDYWAGMYTPGWPLILSIGVVFKAPWLVNPVLGGLLIVSISELARELYDEKSARVAGVMALASPFLGVVSATHLSHTSAALLCTLTWWCALRLMRTGRYRYALAGGAALGLTLLVRPEVAVFVGGVIALGVLVPVRRAATRWRQLALAAGMSMLGGIALLGFQQVAVGEAGTFGHDLEIGSKVQLGFGVVEETESWSRVHTPRRAALDARKRLNELNRWLLGWPVPTAILALTPFFLLRARPREVWLLAPLLALTGFFAFYYYFEEWLPARYLFPAAPMLVILSAHGWRLLDERLRSVPILSVLPKGMLVVGTAYALAVAAPRYQAFFGPHHGDVESALPGIIEAHDVSNALVLMRSSGRLANGRWNDYYATGFMRNALDLDGDVVYARDGLDEQVGLDNEQLIKRYPGRSYYAYEFDTQDHQARLYRLIVEDGQVRSRVPLRSH